MRIIECLFNQTIDGRLCNSITICVIKKLYKFGNKLL